MRLQGFHHSYFLCLHHILIPVCLWTDYTWIIHSGIGSSYCPHPDNALHSHHLVQVVIITSLSVLNY